MGSARSSWGGDRADEPGTGDVVSKSRTVGAVPASASRPRPAWVATMTGPTGPSIVVIAGRRC